MQESASGYLFTCSLLTETKMTDLGLAKRIPKNPDDETIRQLRAGFGTPNYYPPVCIVPGNLFLACADAQ
jgi:hypothetical protein